MRSTVFVFILLLSFFGRSQTGRETRIDSLENALKMAEHDTTRVLVLSELARSYGGVDSLKCFENGFKAIGLSKKINYLRGMADAHINLAGGYLDYFDVENAKKYFEVGNRLADKLVAKDSSAANMKIWLRGYYNLGVAYGYEGNVAKEIEMAAKTIPIAQKMGDKMFVANGNTNLAVKYNSLAMLNESYEMFKISQKQFQEIGSPEDMLYHSISFSSCLASMDSLDQMKSVLDIAKINLDKIPNSFYRGPYYAELGFYYGKVEEYDKALEALDTSYAFYQGKKSYHYLKLLYQRYATVYAKMGDFEKAIAYTLKYINFSDSEHSPSDKVNSYFILAKYEAALDNYKDAYHYLRDYVIAVDSIRARQLGNDMQQLEIQYKTAKKEKEILALKNEKSEAALALQVKRSQTYLLGAIASLLALLLFVGFYAYNDKLRRARKKEREQEKEVALLKQKQENEVFSAMIEGQEKERKRLAIDLHDGLGGRLSGISLNLSKLNKDEPKEYPKAQLQKVTKDLNDALTELRSIARNMMPETLVKFGLQAALKDYCSSMTGNGTKVTLQFYGTEKGIDLNQQVTMYRVIQELINNAVKHAKATEVLVQYMRDGNRVDITVEDNGIGLNKNDFEEKEGGMGISNLRTRVAYLKGDLEFHSEENEGTTVNVQITVDAA
ncbi:sensor histidine kinase [Zobellia galactanivorans]|uniref:tetratricopeptide repeat-containing sensor histidine kinase n=1 Tax=Zobellia galactanivorans (strain DSM 12802 / CCUG 47099 / CIP 106680 / NCIMB 13871 / Dsij) TaxID=63186 RepID=UPI0026E2E190|nr:sensor histidine kinase [Zobellia galactanivorans]MDO6807633.1 sensor histidine kinase [Zobellia galactanivorans]